MPSTAFREKIGDIVRAGIFPGRVRVPLLRAAGIEMGRDVQIGAGFRIRGTGRVVLEDGVGMNVDCSIDCNGDVFIGRNARFGPNCSILTSSHELGGPEQRVGDLQARPVTIGAGVWLGANVIVLPGVTIGEGAVVGAGSLVRRNIPANSLWSGQAARKYKVFAD